MITEEQREQERELFETERRRYPPLFQRPPMIDTDEDLRWIGIEEVKSSRPIGYLRFMPQDFIVEEIARDHKLHEVETGSTFLDLSGEGTTYYADLVKISLSTLEAKDQLAEILGIASSQIGYAGIKDKLALTSQLISLRGLADQTKLESVQSENFFLKNTYRGKGVVANGDLAGNRFIITVRLNQALQSAEIEAMEKGVAEAKQMGFWNFFYFQRFGTPRLLSHRLGRFLIRQEYEEVVRTFLTYTADRELPYFKNIRNELKQLWGDWQAIQEKIKNFPYHFHLELSLINHLISNPEDFLGALKTIPDQIRLWLYAYDCYLFNRKLSQLIQNGQVPTKLPLASSFNSFDWKPYQEFLAEDNVQLPSRAYRDFPFIRVASRTWATVAAVDIHGISFGKQLVVFAFSIPKGSYATTFLMNFFALASGLPIVPGITTEKLDAKAAVGLGSVSEVLERFKTVLEKREQDIFGGGEE